jgi:hypothetical protein
MKIILGAVISLPPVSAGCAWNRLQYVLGLQRLSHDVLFVEEVKPQWCVDTNGELCAYADSPNRRAFGELMGTFGLMERSSQLYNGGEQTTGLSCSAVREFARDADLLIDISGHVTSDFVLEPVARRAYLDQDPVYTQLWRAEYGKDLNLGRYDVFFTVGLNIGTRFSPIPDCGIKWHPTLPPIMLDVWPSVPHTSEVARFTTVASLYGYSDLCYRGECYRSKYHEFRRFAELPRLASRRDQQFEVLLKDFRDDDAQVRHLRNHGWQVHKSAAIAAELFAYRDYIAGSYAEIGITKGAYVKGRSGWFSDRTASYLASGRPAMVQSTGFERCLHSGRGLLSFETLDGAAGAADAIRSNYGTHSRAAREFAEEYFDYRKVLPALLEVCAANRAPDESEAVDEPHAQMDDRDSAIALRYRAN